MSSDPSQDAVPGQADHLRSQLDELAGRLARDYADVATDTLRSYVRAESDRFADARVRAFIPVLVERAVRGRLGRHPALATP
jgi:hypothetical protein